MSIKVVPVAANGRADVKAMEKAISKNTVVVILPVFHSLVIAAVAAPCCLRIGIAFRL